MRIVVGLTGATGIVTGVRLLQALAGRAEVHLVISNAARRVMQQESSLSLRAVQRLAGQLHDNEAIDAPIASGSFITHGMVITPCSIKTLSAIANCYADTLIARAADVTLKQRRPLILAVRETPLHLGHLRLMCSAAEMGALLMPFMPAFYLNPRTIEELVDGWIGRVLDCLGLQHDIGSRYTGPLPRPADGVTPQRIEETTAEIRACSGED